LKEALEEYDHTMAIKLSSLLDDPELYRKLGQRDLSLAYINRALRIDKQQSNNERILADRYHRMNMVLHNLNGIDETVEYFQQSFIEP
jgi:tetratricopeptide (TPR) repeat protein